MPVERGVGQGLARVHSYLRLMRVDRPVGTLLLLWPTLAALWLAAEGVPPLGVLAALVAGTFFARSAGCVINDIADRDVDGFVERTRDRPLPRGEVSLLEAILLLLALSIVCIAIALTLNRLTQALAVAGAIVAAAYPFLKRWTHWPQAALGVAFSWGIPMAYAAVTGGVPNIAWLLFGASLVWIVAYDTIYAMADHDDDLKAGIKSTAVLFGRASPAVVGGLQIVALAMLVGLGVAHAFAYPYYVGVAALAGIFLHQQRLIRSRVPEACMRAFASNVWVGFVLFAAVVVEYAGR